MEVGYKGAFVVACSKVIIQDADFQTHKGVLGHIFSAFKIQLLDDGRLK